jgi:pimeloyl-ACP methyl ester carboxylesterase
VPGIGGYADLVELAADVVPDGSDVVAQSMGGMVAIGLALARPRKIRRLVLVATSGGLDVSGLGGSQWREEYRSEFPQAAAWVTGDALDYTAQLASIELPVCLIWGDCDPISPLAVGHALDRLLPTSKLHVIAGGTHALAREHPDQVAALVRRHTEAAAGG